MTRLVRLVGVLSLVLGCGFLDAQTPATQSAYAGTWVLVPGSIVGRVQGPPPSPRVEIAISSHQLTVKKSDRPYERYPLDGTEATVTVELTGKLEIDDVGMSLTTTRDPGRTTSSADRNVQIVNDRYVVKGDDLLLTRTFRVERPKGVPVDTPQYRWEVRYTRQSQ